MWNLSSCFFLCLVDYLLLVFFVSVVLFVGLEFSFQNLLYCWIAGNVLHEFVFVMEYLVFSIYSD